MKTNAFGLSFWGGDTTHNNYEDVHTRVGTLHIKNIFKCSDWDGDTAHENVLKCSYWGGNTAQFLKKEFDVVGLVGGGGYSILL